MTKMIERISVSRAKAYEQCPAYHDAIYNKKLDQKGDHLYFGSIIHEVLEKWHKNPKKDIMKLYDEIWITYPLSDLDFYREGREMLEEYLSNPDYHEYEIARDSKGELLLERYFRFPLDDEGKVIASGVIDRINHIDDETCEIVDYKTNRMPYTREELEKDQQATLYALATLKEVAPQYKNFIIAFYFLRFGKLSTTRTLEDLEDFRHYFINLYYQISFDTDPKPKLNPYCNYCPIKSTCELYTNLTRDEKLLLGEFPGKEEEILVQLEEIKNKERIIKARRDELESALRNILNTRPDTGIVVGNKQVTLKAKKRAGYSYELVKNLLGQAEAESLASITKSDVDKRIKGNKELQKLFDEGKYEYYTKPSIEITEL